MRIKSVKNNIRRLCGVTAAAAVTALFGWGCGSDPAGPEEGNDSKLILPKDVAWVYTYQPSSIPSNPTVGINYPIRTVAQNNAFIFKADGRADMLTIRGTLWDVEPFQLSWSTIGNKLTLRETGGEEMEFTFSLTGRDSLQILTLQMPGYAPQGYARKAIRIRTPPVVTTFKDSRDSTEYKKVKIGTQTWMAENLNYAGESGNVLGVCYNNSTSNCEKYGRLYDWSTAMGGASSSSANPSGVQGVCPVGWHLPSNAEWDTLITFAGGSATAGTALKSTTGWYFSYGTDDYGFSALPGGHRTSSGSFSSAVDYGRWWSATESVNSAYHLYMVYYIGYAFMENNYNKNYQLSVRCVQD